VYVDAYNLYYGARGHCGRSTAGWRWLDIRAMVTPYLGWPGADVQRVVYCTARVNQADSPSARVDQDVYIRALLEHGSVDHVEEGRYVSWAKAAPLAAPSGRSRRPRLYVSNGSEILDPALPLKRTQDDVTGDDIILATVRRREEKGSDVNVAAHLLRDVFSQAVDAAVVITNDSDLALPLRLAREQVPVGTINPQPGQLAGALRGSSGDGVGRHWWRQLGPTDFQRHQLPDPVGRNRKPKDW